MRVPAEDLFHRYLITGGTGFIGSNLVRSLVAQGKEVHLLVRPGSSLWRIDDIKKHVRCWVGDLQDRQSLVDCVGSAQPQVIVHLGGGSMGRPWDVDFSEVFASINLNLMGTLALLQAVVESGAPVQRFIRMGGLLEYGQGPVPFVESQREQPVSIYPATQVATTVLLNALHQGFDFPIISLRLASVYGPGRSLDFFIPALICAALKGQDFAMTSGRQAWDMLYVDDAIDAIVTAANSDCASGEVINIGSGEGHSLKSIAELIVANVPGAGELKVGAKPEPVGAIPNLTCNIMKAKEILGWQPKTSLETGLKKTIQWYRDHLPQLEQKAGT